MIPKFRALLKTKKEMYYLNGFVLKDNNKIDLYTNSQIIFENISINNIILMQWTGFVDCNNKEVYAGDIIKDKIDNSLYIVKYDYEEGKFWIDEFEENDYPEFNTTLKNICKEYEVVGNIYRNKKGNYYV